MKLTNYSVHKLYDGRQSRRDSNTEATVSRLKQDMTDLWGELCPNGTLCTCGAVLGDAYSFKDIIVVNFSFIETCSLPMFKLCSNAKCKGEAFNPLSLGYFPAQPIQQVYIVQVKIL